MRIDGKRVLLTGASAGIGEQLALQLAARGCKLVLAARSADKLEAVAARCRALGGSALAVPCDVGDEAACRSLAGTAAGALQGLDVVVLNAGITMHSRFEDVTDLSIFPRLMQTNFFGPVYLTHAALPHLRASGGALVAVSSLVGKLGAPTRTAYAASKFALQGFFESLRGELRGSGVQITVVYPGVVNTGIRARAQSGAGTELGASLIDESKGMPAGTCARLIVTAIERGRREQVMTIEGKIAALLKPFAPDLIDAAVRRKLGA